MFGKEKKEIVLQIEGMHCMMCSSRVEKGLRTVKGVSSVTVKLQEKCAAVTFDPAKTNAEALSAVVKQLGYTVTN